MLIYGVGTKHKAVQAIVASLQTNGADGNHVVQAKAHKAAAPAIQVAQVAGPA